MNSDDDDDNDEDNNVLRQVLGNPGWSWIFYVADNFELLISLLLLPENRGY